MLILEKIRRHPNNAVVLIDNSKDVLTVLLPKKASSLGSHSILLVSLALSAFVTDAERSE